MKIIEEERINELCNKYGYSYRYFPNNVMIMTNVDIWKISSFQTAKGETLLVLKHINKKGNRSRKLQFHTQRIIPDIEYAFDIVISRHENCEDSYGRVFKVKKVLSKL